MCRKFELNDNPDFRFYGGRNHGLGDIYIYYPDGPWTSKKESYPGFFFRFSDEGGKSGSGNLIYFLRNDDAKEGKGLNNLSRINRSIEDFCCCSLGSQVNTKSSITGTGGNSMETQQEFLNLFESAIIEENISEIIWRFQNSIKNSNKKINLAISPNAWLLPSDLVINKKYVKCYNTMN